MSDSDSDVPDELKQDYIDELTGEGKSNRSERERERWRREREKGKRGERERERRERERDGPSCTRLIRFALTITFTVYSTYIAVAYIDLSFIL